ncbi:hypothetical protein DM860_005507 [Cuscuta australis]|uniref:G protein gamma domain-containing protein n=1 Tax=Cuscuta australis TaxID=267555 RepID=A0A328E400_9ASTE|nr:hypothetical protein DM860_005507 [Cuscuta australis]
MAGSGGGVPTLPPPQPKSPPRYPDLYGKRRELARVQMLEREIGLLQEELKFVDRLQPASSSCKEVTDFVLAHPDPLLPTKPGDALGSGNGYAGRHVSACHGYVVVPVLASRCLRAPAAPAVHDARPASPPRAAALRLLAKPLPADHLPASAAVHGRLHHAPNALLHHAPAVHSRARWVPPAARYPNAGVAALAETQHLLVAAATSAAALVLAIAAVRRNARTLLFLRVLSAPAAAANAAANAAAAVFRSNVQS